MFLHFCFLITVRLPKPAMEHFNARVMHLSPTMEATTLAQGSDCIWECVVQVMEEHLIPAMLTPEDEGHGIVQHRPRALWVVRKELVPWMRMSEVRDEHPSCTETTARKE